MRTLNDGSTIIASPDDTTDGPVKANLSLTNGECITVRRISGGRAGYYPDIPEQLATNKPVKSIKSLANGECVTVRRDYAGGVVFWDSKQEPAAPEWYFTASEWKLLITGIRDGAFSNDTLRDNKGYNNIVVADDADVEVEIRPDGDYEWNFSCQPDITHVFTPGEMWAFVYAAYTEQISDGDWYTAKFPAAESVPA